MSLSPANSERTLEGSSDPSDPDRSEWIPCEAAGCFPPSAHCRLATRRLVPSRFACQRTSGPSSQALLPLGYRDVQPHLPFNYGSGFLVSGSWSTASRPPTVPSSPSSLARGSWFPALLAFTAHGAVHPSCFQPSCSCLPPLPCSIPAPFLQVENTGIEPVTSCVQSRRSPS